MPLRASSLFSGVPCTFWLSLLAADYFCGLLDGNVPGSCRQPQTAMPGSIDEMLLMLCGLTKTQLHVEEGQKSG